MLYFHRNFASSVTAVYSEQGKVQQNSAWTETLKNIARKSK